MTHLLSPATPVPANEAGRGNLAGHEVRCSCGFVARTSLSAIFAELDGSAHLAWARRRDAQARANLRSVR